MTPLDSTHRFMRHAQDASQPTRLDAVTLARMKETNQRVATHADALAAAVDETSASLGAIASSFMRWRETLRRPTR